MRFKSKMDQINWYISKYNITDPDEQQDLALVVLESQSHDYPGSYIQNWLTIYLNNRNKEPQEVRLTSDVKDENVYNEYDKHLFRITLSMAELSMNSRVFSTRVLDGMSLSESAANLNVSRQRVFQMELNEFNKFRLDLDLVENDRARVLKGIQSKTKRAGLRYTYRRYFENESVDKAFETKTEVLELDSSLYDNFICDNGRNFDLNVGKVIQYLKDVHYIPGTKCKIKLNKLYFLI